ncbi:hypothetical protein ACXZ9C_10670 [Streptococcus agalactiae]
MVRRWFGLVVRSSWWSSSWWHSSSKSLVGCVRLVVSSWLV